MDDSLAERARLEAIANDSWYARGSNAVTVRYLTHLWSRYWRGGSCLELGPAEGLMTETLASRFEDLTVVDGSENFCTKLRERFPDIGVVCSLFESYAPGRQFDTIVLGHVLEHVEDPPALLRSISAWLSPRGRVYGAVPNARSLHRQAAVIMGLLTEEHALNPTDLHHGHRRVFDPESFRQVFLGADMQIEVFGGYWLKPLSNQQLDDTWTPEMLWAFMQLGERYPDIAAEVYIVASSNAVSARSPGSQPGQE